MFSLPKPFGPTVIYTVRFLMDDTVKTAEDVEKIIGVMPLTVILEYQDKDKKKKGRHRRK